jgi:hypothetical protein
MRHILLLSGFDPLLIQKQHELSFPYEFYLRKVLRSLTMAKALTPVIDCVLPVRKNPKQDDRGCAKALSAVHPA